jgi:alcohol dehydrogenase
MHRVGEPMRLEKLPIPEPVAGDVRVRVQAVNIVPNLTNILNHWPTQFPHMPLPTLPAVFGQDVSGVVDAVGHGVATFKPGDRVYVSPLRHCGSCRACRGGDTGNCDSSAFAGYFGLTPKSIGLLDRYTGGLAEYQIAPASALVKLPDSVSFEAGARFGYLGTMYGALHRAGAAPGKTLLVNGISGTLGISAALFAPAFGLTRVYGTGRDRGLLERVEKISGGRMRLHSLLYGPVDEWIREETGGAGVDIYIDALGPNAPYETFQAGLRSLGRGGVAVNVGAVRGEVPIDLHWMMDQQLQLIGSAWFTAGEAQRMADLADAGILDLSHFEHRVFPLEQINEAIAGIAVRPSGGFTNFIISPTATA